jgi:tyrosyl-tRNA synthetase
VFQFGGSDQWSNITSGCDLIKKLDKNDGEGYGITMPLLLAKTG